MPDREMYDWKTMRQQLRGDIERLNNMLADPPKITFLRKLVLLSNPGLLALCLYRLSHYCYQTSRPRLAQLLYRLNLTVTGADIHPRSEIGSGCLLVHSLGFICDGRIGENATIFGHCIIQPDYSQHHWSRSPTIGNNCVFSLQTSVLGDITIADDVTLRPFTLAQESVPEGHVTVAPNGDDGIKIYRKRF